MTEQRLNELQSRGYCHSDFLSLDEQNMYFTLESRSGFRPGLLFGGFEDAERKVLYYDLEEPPISVVEIKPSVNHFTKVPGHRDYLGSLLGLGLDRRVIGDILVSLTGDRAWVFCLTKVADFIVENLTKVGRVSVKCQVSTAPDMALIVQRKEIRVVVTSLRIDSLVAEAFRVSRTESKQLVENKKVYLNGKLLQKAETKPEAGCKITVRGYGSFIFREVAGPTRKEKLSVVLEI
ncbi:MAG: hypothetical protein E7388_05420 [Ruminococcaceae bacterium]|nr:hypothetical protein [Oscillospiraceae bacterium]